MSIRAKEDTIRFNFGPDFFFKLSDHIISEKKSAYQAMCNFELDSLDIHKIVYSYLYFNNYFKTMEEFEKNCGLKKNEMNLLKLPILTQNMKNAKNEIDSNHLNKANGTQNNDDQLESWPKNVEINENEQIMEIIEERKGDYEELCMDEKVQEGMKGIYIFKSEKNSEKEFDLNTRANDRYCNSNNKKLFFISKFLYKLFFL